MEELVPSNVLRAFKDRRALLWVCQRYELLSGEQPHNYGVPSSEALLRYRSKPTDIDRRLASYYWEAIWLEGARSQILSAIRQEAERDLTKARRQVAVLAGPADARAQVSHLEFLPMFVLPGLLEEEIPLDSRYGTVRERARDRIAWDLASKLVDYRGRTLTVIGARAQEDLHFLFEVIEDSPIAELTVLLIWPADTAVPALPTRPGVHLIIWQGTEEDFAAALSEAGAPGAQELPRWTIRVGRSLVTLAAADLRGVTDRFALLTDRDLTPPQDFGVRDLQDFLEGNLDNWKGYGTGLPIPRSYASGQGLSLEREVRSLLELLHKRDSEILTITLQLPSDGGAGTTTLIRSVAYALASAGYPTLVLRPEQVALKVEELAAFARTLSEASIESGVEDLPPLLLVLDVEHYSITGLKQLSQFLAAHGRRALVLQAIPGEEPNGGEKRTKRLIRLKPLRATTTPEEVIQCEEIFRRLIQRWGLPMDVPSLDEWKAYEAANRWPDIPPMFWVALRFFLTERAELTTRDNFSDALGAWIQKRTSQVKDERMKELLLYVAVLSSFRLPSPVWTVLRPITGGTFSSKVVDLLSQLDNLVLWGGPSEELGDQVIRFFHPALAVEYLRREGIRDLRQKTDALRPVLSSLSPGHPGDVWVSESLAAGVLTPPFDERRVADWEVPLKAFDAFPPLVREQSKTILHHWARCLYLSTEGQPPLPEVEKKRRLELAIQKLILAVELPRRMGRDEHPSHLFNTLGVAQARYAKFLESTGKKDDSDRAWNDACTAFEQSINLLPGANLDALLAFSARLLTHAEATYTPGSQAPARSLGEISQALDLLDEAEQMLQEYPAPEPEFEDDLVQYRARALNLLKAGAGGGYLRQLQELGNSDIGYYCEAQLILKDALDEAGFERALDVLRRAQENHVELETRSLKLLLALLRKHKNACFDFPRQRDLYHSLELRREYKPRPIDLFRHAVLCYQTGDYSEGAERFRKLRDFLRRMQIAPPRGRDIWRIKGDPTRPRIILLKVTRITNEWRAEGYVEDLRQYIPFRPRHFDPPPRQNQIVSCVVRFEMNGPLAVPPRFEEIRR